jgi:hypothetical protein
MLSPRGCHAQRAALRPALSGPRESVSTAARIPTTRAADRHCPKPHRYPLSTACVRCATPPTLTGQSCRLRAGHRTCPRRRPCLAVWTPPSPTSPVSSGAVAFTTPLCRTRTAIYTASSRHATVHTSVRPRRALPCTASCAPVTSLPCALHRALSCRTARALMPCRAGPGRGRAGPGWAAHALRRPPAPTLCHWATGGFGPVAFDLYFSIFRIYSNLCKFKILYRIRLNSENYETNFVEYILIYSRF